MERKENELNRCSFKYHIQKLKNKDDRFFYGLAISCITDVVLAAFYFLQTFNFERGLWKFTNSIYYLLLLVGKVSLFWGRKTEKSLITACKVSSIFLMLTGILAMGRTYQYIKMEKVLSLPHSIYILNGIILIVRLLIQPVLKIVPQKKSFDKPDCSAYWLGAFRRRYSWAENLIAFSLLFTNLIVLYEWGEDNALLLSNILQGQVIGLIILLMGISLLRKSNKELQVKEK
ncbi:MAG: hypothetical protein K2K57_04695 [Oscillospiraceae bacterium]|nr:hypothetical protein [Oscillospiraceae bacterium]